MSHLASKSKLSLFQVFCKCPLLVVLLVVPNGVWAYQLSLQNNDATSMFHLASDFENQVPNAGDWHNPCCIYALLDNIRDTLNVSCFGGTFGRAKWCLGLPTFTAKMISLHCPNWQVKVRTLKASCLMLVTDKTLVTFLHWMVRSETLCTHSP